jgi:rhodanese-related sulfurtransferase
MVRLWIVLAAAVLFGSCGKCLRAEEQHTKDSPETVKKALADNKAVLLDVREAREWGEGHLRDARLLPLSKLRNAEEIKELLKDLPKDKPIYCHCQAGRRCLQAAEILKKQGYDVRPLKEGYPDLLEAGFPKAAKR